MPMQWNEQADAKLFANVLKLHVVKLDYQALAKAMGDTVTPKAISHRISKIKEKAQVRRLQSDWEADRDNNPPTNSSTPRKRGLKPKTVDDEDTDDGSKKRIKVEEPAIKVEENLYDDDLGSPDPGSVGGVGGVGDYFWPSGWSPVNVVGVRKSYHGHYDPYELEEGNNNGNASSDVEYRNSVVGGDEDCSSGYGNTPT